jgi:transcriptional regulator with XRE-family HTH domain
MGDRVMSVATEISPQLVLERYVGSRLRQRREDLGISIAEFAGLLKIPADELAAYEAGSRRVSAALLHTIATWLEVPLAWFYDGAQSFDPDGAPQTHNPAGSELALVQGYMERMSARRRAQVVEIARLLAEETG